VTVLHWSTAANLYTAGGILPLSAVDGGTAFAGILIAAVIFWMIGNAKAFNQPCQLGAGLTPLATPTGCAPLTGVAALGGAPTQIWGPGFHRLDFSIFKSFQLTERMSAQFRTEIFNVFNHPNFNAPGFGGNGVVAISGSTNFLNANFGEIGSTRDAPYDPRQIQFALKLYY